MDSKTMVDRYGAQLGRQELQRLLWRDDAYILRNTMFQAVDPEFDRQALIHWWMHIHVPVGHGDEATPSQVYRSWTNSVSEYFRYACHRGGYVPASRQAVVTLSTDHDAPVAEQAAELRFWLPHIRPALFERQNGESGSLRYVAVFEHTLSADGIYRLMFDPKTESSKLERTVYGRTETVREFSTVEEAVEYIAKGHWYYRKYD